MARVCLVISLLLFVLGCQCLELQSCVGYSCTSNSNYRWCNERDEFNLTCLFGQTCVKQGDSSSFPCTGEIPKQSAYPPYTSYNCGSGCNRPDCICATNQPPVQISDMPMMVMLTVDGGIGPEVFDTVNRILTAGHRNPNGCPIRITWFATPENSAASLVQQFVNLGQELALSVVTEGPHIDRIYAARKSLGELARMDPLRITGWRTPKLTYTPETFAAINALGFDYDNSIPVQTFSPLNPLPSRKMFPYTLDFGIATTCFVGVCNYTAEYPKLMSIPLYPLENVVVGSSSYGLPEALVDPGLPNAAVQKLFKDNFDARYQGNRAPFGIYISSWLNQDPSRIDLLNKFLSDILSMKDVWVVSGSEISSFMRNPVASSELTKNNSVFDCQQFPKGSGLSAGSSGSSGPSPFQMQNKNSTNATITSAASFSADSKWVGLVLLFLALAVWRRE